MIDNIELKMKDFYINPAKTKLMRGCPVIARIDMIGAHLFCNNLRKPFDGIFAKSMQETARYLCSAIPGVIFSYQHLDEISLLISDQFLKNSPFSRFDIQEMCSEISSMATLVFEKIFKSNLENYLIDNMRYFENERLYIKELRDSNNRGATFSTEVFNIPESDLVNYFIWRQQANTNVGVRMVESYYYKKVAMEGKDSKRDEKQAILGSAINWEKLPIYLQRGSCCTKMNVVRRVENEKEIERREETTWIIDTNIPVFINDSTNYIKRLFSQKKQ